MIDPLGYLDFLSLYSGARLVLTDSGGIQEETTVLGVPCVTLRESTERPITVSMGTNTIVGTERDKIVRAAFAALDEPRKPPATIPLWDGKTARTDYGCAGWFRLIAWKLLSSQPHLRI